MKIMKIWHIVYYLTISLLFLINKTESGNKKLQKSFGEIFGEGWEEKGQMAEENLDHSNKNNDVINQHETKQSHADQNSPFDEATTDQKFDWIEYCDGQRKSDRQKREIIRTFYAIKEKIKRKGKHSTKEWTKIECFIGKKLETNRNKIYKWIREFGMGMQKMNSNDYSERKKRETIRKFYAIKEKIRQKGGKYPSKEWTKIETIIANKLGTNRDKIYTWKRELGMKCRGMIKDKSTKIEIVQKFDELKNAYKQKGKHSMQELAQKYAEISKKFGISYRTIQNWKKEFGISQKRKSYTNDQKLATMRQYREMKRTNPKISEGKIARALQIDAKTIKKWKIKF